MNEHENLQLRNPEMMPSEEMLEQVLGDSYAAYEALQDCLPHMEIEQVWQWYKPHKAWFARGQHFWTTQRGTQKEKTLYWLHVYEGYFSIAVWFKEKNRSELLYADVSDRTKALIRAAGTMGKVPTFPVVFDIRTAGPLPEMYALIDCKKKLER